MAHKIGLFCLPFRHHSHQEERLKMRDEKKPMVWLSSLFLPLLSMCNMKRPLLVKCVPLTQYVCFQDWQMFARELDISYIMILKRLGDYTHFSDHIWFSVEACSLQYKPQTRTQMFARKLDISLSSLLCYKSVWCACSETLSIWHRYDIEETWITHIIGGFETFTVTAHKIWYQSNLRGLQDKKSYY